MKNKLPIILIFIAITLLIIYVVFYSYLNSLFLFPSTALMTISLILYMKRANTKL